MQVVDVWTGDRANALKGALRLTNEAFAQHLGTAVRTVANWNAQADLVPSPELQQALDTALARSTDDQRVRFSLLVKQREVEEAAPPSVQAAAAPGLDRLTQDVQIANALDWIDEHAGFVPGRAEAAAIAHVAEMDRRSLRTTAQRRQCVTRSAVAEAVRGLYQPQPPPLGFYQAGADERPIETSILTCPAWLDLRLPLGQGSDRLLLTDLASDPVRLDTISADAATRRIAEVAATDARLFNASLYRLTSLDIDADNIAGTVSLSDFFTYALTADLVEMELIDHLAAGAEPTWHGLPLRSAHLPTVQHSVNFAGRVCVGGTLSLFAAARPASRSGRPADYVLLIQERSDQVLNTTGRLAVIPKAFHQPLVDFSDDAQLSATLERELEEELLGRPELELANAHDGYADPRHLSRLSEPMRWLVNNVDTGAWQMEATGFGVNLASGNYEFAGLTVIHDEDWWRLFGGQIETNWEAGRIRQYSSRDHHTMETLVADEAWSNEGLFALLLGIRRLAEVGGSRVHLPTITQEIFHG